MTASMPEYAPWGDRYGAFLLDLILIAVPTVVLVWARFGGEEAASTSSETSDESVVIDVIFGAVDDLLQIATLLGAIFYGFIVALAIYGVYAVVLHAVTGQTLGKRVVNLRVVKLDLSPCDFPSALKRAAVFPGAALVPLLGLGSPIGIFVPLLALGMSLVNGLWPLWDSQHRSLGDKAAGTYVVGRWK